MKKMMLVVAVALCGSAWAATWNVTTGGNLDDTTNWSGSIGDETYKIDNAPQSAPFTISTSSATLHTLRYNTYAYTNDFGGGTLNLNAIHVEYGANLLHRSGTLAPAADSYITSKGPRSGLTLDGSDAVLSVSPQNGKCLTLRAYSVPADVTDAYPYLIVTNGASCSAGKLAMNGAESWGEALVAGSGSSLTISGSTVLGGNSNENPAKGYARRTLTFTDHAKGALNNDTTVGSNSGNNHLVVEDGAEVTVGGTLYLTPKKTDSQMYPASSNNLVTVRRGGRLTAKRLLIGMNSNATNNTVEVLDGGVLNLGPYGDTEYVGWAGQYNTLFISGEGSCVTADCLTLIVGGSNNDVEGSGHNRLIVANGGRLTVLGENGIQISNMGGSVDNALVATNGAIVEAAKISVGARQGLFFDHSTLRLNTGFPLENGARAAFVDSALTLGRTADISLCLNGQQKDAEVAFTNSTIAIGSRIDINGTNVMMRLVNSQIDFNAPGKWLMFGTGSNSDTGLHRFVFGGANPWMKSTAGNGIYFRGYVEMRFELPREGFPTDHAVVDASATKFLADNWTRHKFVVDIHPSCPAGTYPLLKGTNADKLSIEDQFSLTERSGSRAKFVWDSVTKTISVKVKSAGLILLLK